jgi:hypothetical protein
MNSRISSSPSTLPTSQPTWQPFGPYKTKPDYDRAFFYVREWAINEAKDEDLAPYIAARIYHVNEGSLRVSLWRHKNKKLNV